ncbi:hypothetical protein AX15_001908 [Amanita polypyramis BW_CC]|nr:hypothetical protein AX15_001908 [Amanita polypyramis BW_CC]
MVQPHAHTSASLFPSSEMQQSHHFAAAPQDWATYDQALGLQASMSLQSNSYPTSSPYTPPIPTTVPGGSQNGGPRMTLAGSLDPTTGIFYRTPEHPRLRTAQACEKCRTRKAKCSGEHPSCKRCQNRGLVCEYAKEGRVRGPNKPKNKATAPAEDMRSFAPRSQAGSNSNSLEGSRTAEAVDLPQAMMNALREHDKRLTLTPSSMASGRDPLSMGEHRGTRPRPPNLKLDTSNNHYRLDGFQPDVSFQIPPSQDPATIHTASQIPISYQGIHAQTPTGISMDDKFSAFAYEENRSPSTSSSTSMQGHHSSGNPSMIHLQSAYLQGMSQHMARDDGRLRSSASSSPTTLAYRTPGDMTASPTVGTPSMLHYSRHNGGNNGFETLHPDIKSPTHMDVNSMPLPLDHAWVEMNNTDVQYGNRGSGQTIMNGQNPVLHAPAETNNGLHILNGITGTGGAVGGDNVPSQVQALYPIDLQMR